MGEALRHAKICQLSIITIFGLLLLCADASAQQKRVRRRLHRAVDPEAVDDAQDTSRPAELTYEQRERFKQQWHPSGMGHPLSDNYPGYRGAHKAVLTPETATLSAEIFPMYYTPVTRSSAFKLRFSSNIFRTRDVAFEAYHDMSKYINFNFHPTKVKLDLWGNVFWLKYSSPTVVDEFDVTRAVEYGEAELVNTMVPLPRMNVKQQNMVFLEPQRRYAFKAANVRKIAELDGRVLCTTQIRRVRGHKMLAALRAQRLKRENDEITSRQKMEFGSSLAGRKKERAKGRRLQSGRAEEIDDGVEIKSVNINKLEEDDGFSKTKMVKEMRDGKRSMLLLYSKKYIREIILVCKVT
mgnify:CR=1 FL=1